MCSAPSIQSTPLHCTSTTYSYGRLNLLYVRNSAMLISERFGSVVDNGRCDRNRLCKFVIHIHTLTRVCCHVLRNVSIGEIVSCTGVGVAVSLPHTLSIHDFLVPMEHSFFQPKQSDPGAGLPCPRRAEGEVSPASTPALHALPPHPLTRSAPP